MKIIFLFFCSWILSKLIFSFFQSFGIVFLKDLGYTVLETNYRHGRLEADILALNDGVFVIVEVKTRSNSYFGQPEEFVTQDKQNHLIAIANHYLEKLLSDFEVRFDVIAVLKTDKGFKIEHIEDAFHLLTTDFKISLIKN